MTVEAILESVYVSFVYFKLIGLAVLIFYLLMWWHELLHFLPSKAMGLNPKILFKHKIIPSEVDDDFPKNIKPTLKDKILLLYLPYLLGLPIVFALFVLGFNIGSYMIMVPCVATMIWHIFTFPRENFYHVDHPEGKGEGTILIKR